MKRRNTVLVAALALIVALAAYGTVAAFNHTAHVTNVITTGEIDIVLEEYTKDGDQLVAWPTDGISGVMPGTPVDKIVSVKNVSDASSDAEKVNESAWVRIWVNVAITDGKDLSQTLTPVCLPLTIGDVELVQPAYKTDWFQGEDGYWYYKKPVPAGESTTTLFDEVNIAKEMDNRYQNCKIIIDVYAEAVQVKNNQGADPDAPITLLTQDNYKDIKGWPENNT